jgi:Asp-tRNA(Asn)/Glu-tRNA(Gln) amidotransferase A subunit family amidase
VNFRPPEGHPAALGAVAAAAELANGQLSAVELTRGYLEQIERCNGQINAYLHVDEAGALAQAAASDERRARGSAHHPLDGIPFGIKDNIAVAGMPLTAGLEVRRQRIASEDAHCVAKLRRAGAVFLGKLHLHEGALGADSDNPFYGRCHNPLRPGYTPGGSSGGSAAALAAHLCALSLGTDSMGSVRIPAAYCGVVALKPSAGRVSQRGLVTVSHRLDHVGPMARSCTDLAAVLQQISGVDLHDPQSRLVPLAHAERAPERLRVGVLRDLHSHGVDADVIDCFERAIVRLEALLPRTESVVFDDVDFGRSRRAGLLLCEAEMNLVHAADLAAQPEQFSPELRQMLAFARSRSAVDLAAARNMLDRAVVKAREVFARVDVLLTPTTPQAAFAFGTAVPVNQADLTSFANFAGIPALSLPMGLSKDGMPLGVQLLGPMGSDLQLMALAERIEVLLGAP